ncbi:MAG: hypothetical protein ACE5O2_09785 [Armatimonadota bacterium]
MGAVALPIGARHLTGLNEPPSAFEGAHAALEKLRLGVKSAILTGLILLAAAQYYDETL